MHARSFFFQNWKLVVTISLYEILFFFSFRTPFFTNCKNCKSKNKLIFLMDILNLWLENQNGIRNLTPVIKLRDPWFLFILPIWTLHELRFAIPSRDCHQWVSSGWADTYDEFAKINLAATLVSLSNYLPVRMAYGYLRPWAGCGVRRPAKSVAITTASQESFMAGLPRFRPEVESRDLGSPCCKPGVEIV